MQKKHPAKESVPQESNGSPANADARRHPQEQLSDAASTPETQRDEEQKSHKMRQPTRAPPGNGGGGDPPLPPAVPSASTRDILSDDEVAAEASGHAQAGEPPRSCRE